MFVEDWTKWLRLLLIFMPFCILTALMRDVDILHIFCVLLLLADAIYSKLSKLVLACPNYSLARDTVWTVWFPSQQAGGVIGRDVTMHAHGGYL